MTRVQLIAPKTATGERKAVLDQVTAAFRATPAMFRAVANSPAALKMMWAGFGAEIMSLMREGVTLSPSTAPDRSEPGCSDAGGAAN